jgi:hypothetical protein
MQDIRPELRERLKHIQDRRETVQRELTELDAIERGLQTVLNSEDETWKKLAPTPPLFQQASGNDGEEQSNGVNLHDLLLEFLRDGQQWSTEVLKQELLKRGYPFGGKAPGRVINFALVGLENRGSVTNLKDGRWQIKK